MQLFTEPGSGHPGWVAQLTAGRGPTALTIPEWVTCVEHFARSSSFISTLTEEVIPHKGRKGAIWVLRLAHGQRQQ